MKTSGLFLVALVLFSSFAFAASQTLTGKVSDDMCGRKHMLAGKSDAQCTRECIKAGSHYALVSGDKIYKLTGADARLDKHAGAKVTITGEVKGDSVQVTNVVPAN